MAREACPKALNAQFFNSKVEVYFRGGLFPWGFISVLVYFRVGFFPQPLILWIILFVHLPFFYKWFCVCVFVDYWYVILLFACVSPELTAEISQALIIYNYS